MLGFFRAILVDFPPAVLALKLLVQKVPISAADRHVLANAFFQLGRKLLPAAVSDAKVFESSRVLLHFLLSRFRESDLKSEEGWEAHPLCCALTLERLTTPVRLPAASAEVYERAGALARIQSQQGVFARLEPSQLVGAEGALVREPVQ